jgi:hypothetical protein
MIQRWTVKRFVVSGPSLSIPDYWFGLIRMGKKRVVYVGWISAVGVRHSDVRFTAPILCSSFGTRSVQLIVL